MVELRFTNSDATPKVVEIRTRKRDVPIIMCWYGAYYAGDRYSVHVDGVTVEKDQNGEMKEAAQ